MRGMLPEDVYELTGVADPRLSPDGKTVAYVVWRIDREESEYRSVIWLAALDGSSPPRQFTGGSKRDSSPRWSSDGTQLAFTSNRERDASQLYVIPVVGGEAKRLTDLKEDVSDVVWSPDGSNIAFCSRVRDEAYEEKEDRKRRPRRITRLQFKLDNVGWIADRRQHVFTVAADGSEEAVQLTKGDYESGSPAWSPDGSRIAFVSAMHEDWDIDVRRDVFLADISGAEPERITSDDGGCDLPSWSPDGRSVAYYYYAGILDEPRNAQVAVTDVSTGERRVLAARLDRNCCPYPPMREPIWDGDDLVFALEDRGNIHLYCVPSDASGEPVPIVEGELSVTGYDVARGRVAHAQSTPTELPEIYAGERKLTEVGRRFAKERDLSGYERFTALSKDGTEVECWIVRPAGFDPARKYPALLNIHGGPFTQYGNRFFDEFQVYAGAGYVVVFCNPRGSSGYSEEWGRATRGPIEGGPGWGSYDYEDVMACIETAVEKFDFIDGEHLGVMGGSYGGYMTSWIVGHTNRFKTAISERSVNNFVSEFGSSDFGWSFKGFVGGFLHEDLDAYWRISPQAYATEIETPLLILHSENDLRCNVEQAENLFAVLRVLKREVEMVRFPAESHELTRSGSPAHRVMRYEVILDWLGRYLHPEPATWPTN